ncbi:MAG TPA: hypothetical protein VGX28_09865 [Frankiaceae bacterium]|jgi:hypothetical protein|nr:hypothetical protein [Frankiaceae bacterium]
MSAGRAVSRPTPFTRKVGLVALVAEPLAFVLVLTMHGVRRDDAATLVGVVAAVHVLWWLGLLVRHAGHWWARPILLAALFSLAGALVAGTLGALALSVATYALILGVLAAGELPRPAAALVLLAWPATMYASSALGELMGLVGHLWLAWALAREPLPTRTPRAGSVPASPGPA